MKLNKLLLVSASLLLLVGCNGPKSTSTNSNQNSVSTQTNNPNFKKINITKPIKSLDPKSCPSTGKVKALVVPIHFSDDTTTKIDLDLIKAAFDTPKDSSIKPEWYDVKSFYQTSSYGKLDFEFTFLDTYIPSNTSTYYSNKSNFNGDDYNTNSSRTLYKEILEKYDSTIDFSQYDSDKDGIIDAMFMIYDHPVDYTYKNMYWWAYTSWYEQDDKFDGINLGKYVWCGQDFFKKDNLNCNTQTIIHETSHLFGIDDYYDYATDKGAIKGGLGGADLMDNANGSPCGDHNSYSKCLLNWSTPTLITTQDDVTITLDAMQNKGDCIILANEFDEEKEMYQEYFLLEYYTPTKIQSRDLPFSNSGIKVYHVSSELNKKGKIKNDNSYSVDRLISQINTKYGDTYINSSTSKDDSTLFTVGEKLEKALYNDGSKLKYAFEVISEENETCTIKISKIN